MSDTLHRFRSARDEIVDDGERGIPPEGSFLNALDEAARGDGLDGVSVQFES